MYLNIVSANKIGELRNSLTTQANEVTHVKLNVEDIVLSPKFMYTTKSHIRMNRLHATL